MVDLQQIMGAGFERVLSQMPAAVVIAEAPSGRIIFSNREAQHWTEKVLGQRVPSELVHYRDLQESSDFEVFHPDGRPYEMEEWPLMRSIRDGEEVRGEEIIHLLADGSRHWSRYDSSPIYDDEEGRLGRRGLGVRGVWICGSGGRVRRPPVWVREHEVCLRFCFACG
jgi:hypothetical protein